MPFPDTTLPSVPPMATIAPPPIEIPVPLPATVSPFGRNPTMLLSIVAVDVLPTRTPVVLAEMTFGAPDAPTSALAAAPLTSTPTPLGTETVGVTPMRLPRIVADAETAFNETPSARLPAMTFGRRRRRRRSPSRR